jgi:hypothetical protein
MNPLAGLRRWRAIREREREMHHLAERLIAPVRARVDAGDTETAAPGPDALFEVLVDSARQWRGERRLEVHRVSIPRTFRATGMWLERADRDDIIVEADAEVWHQAQILGHELWHMRQKDSRTPGEPAAEPCTLPGPEAPPATGRPAAARSRFDDDPEKEAELFGILVGQRMRALMERDVIAGDTARRIADSLGYQRGRR